VDVCAPVQVTLVGGMMDGDTVLLTPHGSVGPANAFGYLSNKDGKTGFHLYTCGLDVISTWEKIDVLKDADFGGALKRKFYYWKFVPLFEDGEVPT